MGLGRHSGSLGLFFICFACFEFVFCLVMLVKELKSNTLRKTGERLRGQWVQLPYPSTAFGSLSLRDASTPFFDSCSTPISIDQFLSAVDHISPEWFQWLSSSLRDGVRIGYTGPRNVQVFRQNNASALSEPLVVDDLLAQEVSKGFLIGPFQDRPLVSPGVYLSHVNALTLHKKDKYRLCIDLSGDLKGTVNFFISAEDSSVDFSTIDDVVDSTILCGSGALIAKLDLKDAYKILPVHRDDVPLLGIRWRRLYFVSVRLVFGLRSAARLFNNVSTTLVWALDRWTRETLVPERFTSCLTSSKQGGPWSLVKTLEMRHLLDDFIFIFIPFLELAEFVFGRLIYLFNQWGFPLNVSKTCYPASSQIVFGIGLNTILGEYFLPESKIIKGLEGLKCVEIKGDSLTKRDMQSLIGLLAFLARALVASRTFLRRLIDSTCGLPFAHSQVILDGGVQQDIQWWTKVLSSSSSFAMGFSPSELKLPHVHELASDSSLFACGATFKDQWFAFEFTPEMISCNTDIAVKELVALTLAVLCWGGHFRGQRLLVHCDNQVVNAAISSGTCKNRDVMLVLRFLVLHCLHLGITVSTSYIRSADNLGPDLLSRMRVRHFLDRFPDSAPQPSPVVSCWKTLFEECLHSCYSKTSSLPSLL